MRAVLVFAVAVLVVAAYSARYADQVVSQPAAHVVGAAAQGPREPISSGRSLMVEAGRDGHYAVESRVNGRFVDFLVDTGASLVILRETDAFNAGMRPRASDYTATVSTANGKVKAAPVRIDRIEIGGMTVYDVPALVLPDDILSKNLLGMSFLSRLKRYEVASGRMVLEQ